MHLCPVWVNSNFDPLSPNFYPLFTENIQYSQGFAVLYPMNMHFYASIYNFGFPKVSRKFHMTLSCIVLYRYLGKSAHCQTILYHCVHYVLLPRGSNVGQKFCVFIDYRRFSPRSFCSSTFCRFPSDLQPNKIKYDNSINLNGGYQHG